jgi:uncharacterized protein
MKLGSNARLPLYLLLTFGITWTAWWLLAPRVPAGGSVFANAGLATLYLLGGFGPTIAALVVVAVTPREGAFAEYAARLFRWRLSPVWYGLVLLVPPLMAFAVERVAAWGSPGAIALPTLEPLTRLPVLFLTMMIGGGLEELGWRGVAQEELQRRLNRLLATACVGAIWAVWHLPLFFIHGVAQFGGDFLLFALGVIANAFLLAWVYWNTRSILMCVLFHAASNTASAMGLDSSAASMQGPWLGASIKLIVAAALLAMSVKPERANESPYPS